MFTLIGIAYLALRACGVQQATRDLQPIAFANRYGLTRFVLPATSKQSSSSSRRVSP